MMRFTRRLVRAMIAAAVVLAPPTAALLWALQPATRATLARLPTEAANPPPDTVLTLVAAAAATALWLLVSVLIVQAGLSHAHQLWRRMRHLPLPTPMQAAASSLAGAALLGLPTLSATPGNASAPPPAGATNPDPADLAPPATTAGVELPDGGWLPGHTARDIAAVIGMTWLRRRQTLDPGTALPSPPALPDVATIAAAHAPDNDDGPLPTEQLPAGPTTFTGPGAADAARGVLVTALLAATAHTNPAPHIVITPADLHRLLNTDTVYDLPGLHLTDQPHTVAQRLADQPAHQPVQVIHITVNPPEATHRPPPAGPVTLTSIEVNTNAHGGPRWQINRDGTTTTTTTADGGNSHGRLCVLSAQTATDLIRLALHARGLATLPPAAATLTPRASAPPVNTSRGPAPAHLDVLGECRLRIARQPVTLSRSAAWQILVYLATHPDGATTQQLITAIWPGLLPATITGRLYTTLNHLRAQTRDALNGRDLIRHAGSRYQLNPDLIDTDLQLLNHAIARAATALTTSERLNAHQATIAAYQGELAAGHCWPWLYPLREELIHSTLNAYTTVAAASPPTQAITLLRQAITIDPHNERVHQLAIRALHDNGDHDDARTLADAYNQRATLS